MDELSIFLRDKSYVAEETAVSYHPTAIETNGYELGAAFCPIIEAPAYNLSSGEQILLQAALTATL